MNNSEKIDQLLKQALSPDVEPSEAINTHIINQWEERTTMKPTYQKRLSIATTAAIITLAMSITAFAAWSLLTPKEVAENLGNQTLANAFTSEDAIVINQSATADGYQFTLHGIVSGEELNEFSSSTEHLQPTRTYAVLSISRQDGTPMPTTQDEQYGQTPFFISPLIKGQQPWLVNIASMNGGYSEFVQEGIMYRLIECDEVEMFADRGVYLAIISDSTFYTINAFDYDEATGELSPKADYQGANILFDLPLDVTKADHEKAERYLQKLLNPEIEPRVSLSSIVSELM